MIWELAHTITLIAAIISSVPGFLAYAKTRGRLIIIAQLIPDYEIAIETLKAYKPYSPLEDQSYEGVPDIIICNVTITSRFSIPMFLHQVYIKDEQGNLLHSKSKSYTQHGTVIEPIKQNAPIRIEPNDTKTLQFHMLHNDTFKTPKKVFAVDGVRKIWSSKVCH